MKRIGGVLFGAIVVISACGGGGSSALSKDDFLSKGNVVCKTGNDAIDAGSKTAFPDQTQQPDPATIQKFFNDTLAPNVKKQIDGIAALKPPSDMQSAVDQLVKDARARLSQLQDQVSKDPSVLFSSADPFADVNKEANAIGLTTCGSNGSASSGSSSSSS